MAGKENTFRAAFSQRASLPVVATNNKTEHHGNANAT